MQPPSLVETSEEVRLTLARTVLALTQLGGKALGAYAGGFWMVEGSAYMYVWRCLVNPAQAYLRT
jgi:hypothetical protein